MNFKMYFGGFPVFGFSLTWKFFVYVPISCSFSLTQKPLTFPDCLSLKCSMNIVLDVLSGWSKLVSSADYLIFFQLWNIHWTCSFSEKARELHFLVRLHCFNLCSTYKPISLHSFNPCWVKFIMSFDAAHL